MALGRATVTGKCLFSVSGTVVKVVVVCICHLLKKGSLNVIYTTSGVLLAQEVLGLGLVCSALLYKSTHYLV